jgi:RNA polymerase sigma-70 factor (ECF subfamily)
MPRLTNMPEIVAKGVMPVPMLEPFLAALAPCLRERLNHPELGRFLHERRDAARAKWPSLRVPDDVLAAFLGERVPTDAQSPAVLACMQVEELLLTCACVRGDSAAIRILQEEYFPPALAALARLGLDGHDVDEITQVMLERLLLGRSGRSPRILAYCGRGDLASWLRICAIRTAYRHLRNERSRTEAAEDPFLLPDEEIDPEAGYARQSCRMLFTESLDEAAWTLTPREKRLLGAHYLDGLTLSETGLLHGFTARPRPAGWPRPGASCATAPARR